MSVKRDKEELKSFVNTCDTSQLAQLTASAVHDVPSFERALRKLWQVVIAASPVKVDKSPRKEAATVTPESLPDAAVLRLAIIAEHGADVIGRVDADVKRCIAIGDKNLALTRFCCCLRKCQTPPV